MFIQILSIYLILIIEQIQANSIQHYHCDEANKINEIKNIKNHLKRLIRHDDKIYFVFKNRVLFTRLFDLDGPKSNHFVMQNFYEIKQKNHDTPDKTVIWGYVYDQNFNMTMEIIYNKSEVKRLNEVYILNFDTDQFLEYSNEAKVKLNNYYINLFKQESLLNTDYLAIWKSVQNSIGIQLVKQNQKYSVILNLIISLRNRWVHLEIKDFLDAKMFVIWTNENILSPISKLYLLSVDSLHFRLGIAFYRPNKSNSLSKLTIDFDELLSCHTKFKNSKQVKGIYYDSKTNQFFIFIKRFYLKIGEDLIENEFYLDDNVYKKARSIDFKEYYDSIKFEILAKKWVRIVEKSSYFIPESRHYFELSTNDQKELEMTKLTELDGKFDGHFQRCITQTIVFDKHVFCFLEYEYFFLYDMNDETFEGNYQRHSIASIFDLNNQWDKNEPIHFIFNYFDDLFVIMTLNQVLVFDYDQFQVNHFVQTIKWSGSNIKIKKKNCFFNPGCVKPIKPVTVPIRTETSNNRMSTEPTSQTTTSKSRMPDAKRLLILRFVGLFIGLTLLVLILCLFLMIFYNQRPYPKRYRNYSFNLPEMPNSDFRKAELKSLSISADLARVPSVKTFDTLQIKSRHDDANESQVSKMKSNSKSTSKTSIKPDYQKNYSQLSIQSTKIMPSCHQSKTNLIYKTDRSDMLSTEISNTNLLIGKLIRIPKPIKYLKSKAVKNNKIHSKVKIKGFKK